MTLLAAVSRGSIDALNRLLTLELLRAFPEDPARVRITIGEERATITLSELQSILDELFDTVESEMSR